MRLVSFINILGLGGTEKAACRWVAGLKMRGHEVVVLTLRDGPRRIELEAVGVETVVLAPGVQPIVSELNRIQPEVIHAHAPGQPHMGDVLGEALASLPKIPVVQTNIFGQFQNPKEDAWTDFRLFISWTSCVQAARRSFRQLTEKFFRRCSVAVYPVDPCVEPSTHAINEFRRQLGVGVAEVLFGRISRPEINKWSSLALDAFRRGLQDNPHMKLLLREPPQEVANALRASPDSHRFIILPTTSDADELRLTMAALDVVLHTSSIGESFGYGIAEPMNLGKPVITHSVPWHDQAQIELVRHGDCGYVVSTPAAMAGAIVELAGDRALRSRLGSAAQRHIRKVAAASTSIERLESILRVTAAGRDNPFADGDLRQAKLAEAHLDKHQFGHTLQEQLALKPFYYRTRFSQFRKAIWTRQQAGRQLVLARK